MYRWDLAGKLCRESSWPKENQNGRKREAYTVPTKIYYISKVNIIESLKGR